MGEVVVSGGADARAEKRMEKAGEEPRERMVRWEKFLPRMSLRVLLVEADDSTRQIIAALLRKCSYKVAAASSGFEAWEILKEKPHNIDLVLTEVELPNVSGYGLLSMIMEHDNSKNIPVIMMSSYDSMSMVFKCMLKGAADFLVKPIRKNELRNLWQHVWRRQSSNGGPGGTCAQQVENIAPLTSGANSEYNSASNHSSDFMDSLHKNRECSKKGSDTQSSCTRPDTEAESASLRIIREQSEINCINSIGDRMTDQKDDISDKLEEKPRNSENETQGKLLLSYPSDRETSVKIAMSTGRFGDRNVQYDNNEQSFGQSSSSREVDLTAPAEHQSHHNYGLKRRRVLQAGVPNDQVLGVDNSQKFKPQLELSLRKIQDENAEKKVKDVSRLNHSHSSAFSRYSARITPSPLPQSTDLGAEEPRGSPGDGSGPSGENPEPTNAKSPGLQKRDGRNPQPNPEFPALPRPATGAAHDDPRSGYGSVIRTVFYSQSGPHVWSLSPGVDQPSLPCRPDREIVNVPGEKTHQPSQLPQKQIQEGQSSEERLHVSSITGQSGGSPAHISGVNVESVHGGGSVLTCDGAELTNLQQRSMQREAALNKFRLKRKERCYEKKVRYQSRKRLAEQRPRVKGQFVRQAKPDL
ncbi:unnamed protein product [Spirodela intermedia]|uniref:Uncharacterized protein n=1 Tax=Spirodela intermedia TaxID=51605 RepID=A0A7I8LL49_SPIIN|nr:unnamed protein product [Spirodela intermedia]